MKLLQSKFQLSHQMLMIASHIQLYWLARPLTSSLILIIWHNMKVSYVFINDIYLKIYFIHRREYISRLSLPANMKLNVQFLHWEKNENLLSTRVHSTRKERKQRDRWLHRESSLVTHGWQWLPCSEAKTINKLGSWKKIHSSGKCFMIIRRIWKSVIFQHGS